MSKQGSNEDIGYHDLLFNSAVACILLFVIFSVKVGTKATLASIGTGSEALTSSYSIVPSEDIGEMLSVRMVKISGLSSQTQERIKKNFIAGENLGHWQHGGEPMEGTEIPIKQIHIDGNAVVFTLILGKMSVPKITFTLAENAIPLSEGVVTVQASILEGSSAMAGREDFSGYYGTNPERRNPSNVLVEFMVIGDDTFDNAIRIR